MDVSRRVVCYAQDRLSCISWVGSAGVFLDASDKPRDDYTLRCK